MARFWLGTYEVDPPIPPSHVRAEPIVALGAEALAIEVVKGRRGLAVLFSAVDAVDQPRRLTCRIGFANSAEACSEWRDRGFPFVDAAIEYDGHWLRIISPYFSEHEAMEYGEHLISIAGVQFDDDAGPAQKLDAVYEQCQESPDSAWPATYLRQRPISWQVARSDVKAIKPRHALELYVTAARCPNLRPLEQGGIRLASAWSGELDLRNVRADCPKAKPQRVKRADLFGDPEFRFDDVEVIGFRIDLGKGAELDQELAELIDPLNFHLSQPANDLRAPDFRYRIATRTLLIELLRYGRMRLRNQEEPLTALDYQSQHELAARVLVGLVDDDTAQAHAPAVFVPAIFVDNPWSKILGRDVQGFDKCTADFCIDRDMDIVPLRPDGRCLGEAAPRALGEISQINLVSHIVNGTTAPERKILTLDCAPHQYRNWDDFQKINLDVALSGVPLFDQRWRQTDFDQTEFRRSFARLAMKETLRGFRSIQVTPLGDRGLEKAWIKARFKVDNGLRMVHPAGGARLAFYAPDAAPHGWKQLCRILGLDRGADPTRSFATGSWYRLKFSMTLTVDDALDWD